MTSRQLRRSGFLIKTAILICFVLCLSLVNTIAVTHSSPDPASSITSASILKTIKDLVAFGTRNCKKPQLAVKSADYLARRLKETGYETSADDFTLSGLKLRNVVGVLPPAAGRADRIIIIGAHYDSKGGGPDAPAPGADDNGSGVAAVLAAANALKSVQTRAEIRIVFFTGDEYGALGSKHYVSKYMRDEKRRVIMLNADYIGTKTGAGDGTMVVYGPRAGKIFKMLEKTSASRRLGLHVMPMPADSYPKWWDSQPFTDAGFLALTLVREEVPGLKGHEVFHTPKDLPERMNIGQVVKVSRLMYYTVLDLSSEGH
jgi:hypothetical protein